MKKFLLLLYFAAFSALFSIAQKDTAFIYTFGGENDEQGRDIELTSDSGFIMVGSTSSFGAGNSDIYLVKVDSNIKYEWSAAIGHEFTEFGYAVKQTADNGYIICGHTNSIGNGSYDAYLVRTDDKGKLLWEKTFGGFNWEFAYDLEITSDGGFLIVGETHSLGEGNADAYLIRTDKDGNLLWEKTMGGAGKDIAHALISTKDGNFAFCGENASKNPENKGDAWLVKFDGNGDTLFDRTRLRPLPEVLYGLVQSESADIYVTGYTESFNKENKDVLAARFSANGDFIREDHFGGAGLSAGNSEDIGYDLLVLDSGKIALCGFSKSFSSDGSKDFYSSKLSYNIYYESGTTHGLDQDDEAYAILYKNGYVFFGSGQSYNAEYSDFMLIQTAVLDSLAIVSTVFRDNLTEATNSVKGFQLQESIQVIVQSKKITINSDKNIKRIQIHSIDGALLYDYKNENENNTYSFSPYKISSGCIIILKTQLEDNTFYTKKIVFH